MAEYQQNPPVRRRASGGITYRESDGTAPGDEPVVADLGDVRVGLTVCYDLRFPELYRELAGATRRS